MDIRLKPNGITHTAFLVVAACTVISGTIMVGLNVTQSAKQSAATVQSETIEQGRVKGLDAIVKNLAVNNVYSYDGTFTVGQFIPPDSKGNYPSTDSLKDKVGQYAHIGVVNGKMTVISVHTAKAVQNQQTLKK